MELHEYQIKSLLQRFKIPSPSHVLVSIGDSVETVVSKLDSRSFYVRPQVHGYTEMGFLADSPEKVGMLLKETVGSSVITPLSGPTGFVAAKVLVVPVLEFAKNFALSISSDYSAQVTVSVGDGEKKRSEQVSGTFLRPFQLRRLTFGLKLRPPLSDLLASIIERAVQAFFEFDALVFEISPLALSEAWCFQAMNARMSIDDTALFRQPEIKLLADPTQIGPRIHTPPYLCADMGGTMAVLANGKGLALGTMDLIALHGGVPGKVLDMGSAIVEERLVKGLRVLYEDRSTDRLFLNLFTGIDDAERIARVIAKEIQRVPTVVRLEGTNGALGRRLLGALRPVCIATDSLEAGAKQIAQGW